MLMMKKSIYLIILFISCVIIGCHRQLVTDQGISLKVLRMVDKLESQHEIHVDVEGVTKKKGSHKIFQKLIKKASTEELLLLMQHPSSVVRGYSFWALAKKNYEHIDEVIVERVTDEEPTVLVHNSKKKSYPLIEILAMIVRSDELDPNCKKLTEAELIRFEKYRRLVNLVFESKKIISWPKQDIEAGQRKILGIKYTHADSCTNKLCVAYNENQEAFDLLRNLVEIYPGIELGIGVFASEKSDDTHTKQFACDIAERIKESLESLGVNDQGIFFLGFGSKKMHPNYTPISQLRDINCWVELVIIEKKVTSKIQSWVEYDKHLSEIDFSKGKNIGKLEDYLLACLYQLEKYKMEKPSFDLFLAIYKQAINGPKVHFDRSWISKYEAKRSMSDEESDREWEALTEWERVTDHLRRIATDLINTREIRSKPSYVENNNYFFWETEWGQRFYNGSLPGDILYYAATRFNMEYSIYSHKKVEVRWEGFYHSFMIGMEYE